MDQIVWPWLSVTSVLQGMNLVIVSVTVTPPCGGGGG